ncbi:hypothetical protein PQ465_05020 [Sphingobacterium oryzagri]|uniref:Anti-sigma factor n=1 Tax=Sphingobacterium oryzagri TaxID=3025669 RepID=A0ABY7WJG5_9SPHI|nr:hypothetical protein [Sphingobacterium sp. KACC 22765]WDF69742.1 hypothetical protein PQ465_05020 [Sphingobacterium sp. KACC 22765]
MNKLKINKELLERYELGQCTEQEQAIVKLWLDDEDLTLDESLSRDDVSELKNDLTHAEQEAKADLALKQDLWQNISAHMQHADADKQQANILPSHPSANRVLRKAPFRQAKTWLSVAAAAAVFLCLGWWTLVNTDNQSNNFNATNSEQTLMLWEEDGFELALSQNSSASINLQSENIAVSGDILFTPKRDFVLHDKHGETDFNFRQGQVYYISTNPNTSKLMVFSQQELQYLPPILRKHIRKQFNLT